MESYLNRHIARIKQEISSYIADKSVDSIIRTSLEYHLKGTSASFQKYYFEILENETYFLSSETFFRDFKYRYALQGVDIKYLEMLESNKSDILSLLHKGRLADIYFDYFAKAIIKHGSTIQTKDLGSFFTKLVHTFRPADYCALDIQIKNYFGLEKESYFIALIIISSAYKLAAIDSKKKIKSIRQEYMKIDAEHVIQHERVTDIKLFDMIYWSKANLD